MFENKIQFTTWIVLCLTFLYFDILHTLHTYIHFYDQRDCYSVKNTPFFKGGNDGRQGRKVEYVLSEYGMEDITEPLEKLQKKEIERDESEVELTAVAGGVVRELGVTWKNRDTSSSSSEMEPGSEDAVWGGPPSMNKVESGPTFLEKVVACLFGGSILYFRGG